MAAPPVDEPALAVTILLHTQRVIVAAGRVYHGHRMLLRAIIALVAAVPIMLVACGDSYSSDDDPTPPVAAGAAEPTPTLRTIDIELEDRSIIVEVADDPAERTQGLSDRDSLPRDGGMLFVWDQPAEYTLWMKDMRFALDFVWLDEDHRVTAITPDVPHQPGASDSELVRYSSGPGAVYAIELNAGSAERFGIETGDQLEFDVEE